MDNRRIQVKTADRNTIKLINRFNILSKTEIGKSFLIRFEEIQDDSVVIDYRIEKTVWDKKEKDFCLDLFMFDRSNSNFYLYPQANEVYIPIIDSRKYFNILVKELFDLDIDISKKNLDRLFQSLKLTGDKEKRSRYIKECIEKSLVISSGTNLGKLLYRDLSEELIELSELDCQILEFRFTQNLINIIEIVSQIIAGLEERTQEGLINTNILIHRNLIEFFSSELWNKLKNIFGVYDKEFINSGSISGLIPELSMNVLFLPVIQDYLNSGLLTLEELDRRYFELSNNSKLIYSGKRDYCFKRDNELLDSIVKAVNLSELLPVYESTLIQVIPNLSLEELNDFKFIDYFNYKNNQLLTLAEFNKIKKIYSKESNSIIDSNLSIEDKGNSSTDLPDSSLYLFPRKISDLMVSIFSRYFI